MSGNNIGVGRLCRGQNSLSLHYWWFRTSDGFIKDRSQAVKQSVRWIMASIANDRELSRVFRLNSEDARRHVMIQLYGEIDSFLDSVQRIQSTTLYQAGRDRDIVVYKPVRLAVEKNVPLYELVSVPVVHPHGSGEFALELRIYESEPLRMNHLYVGHWAGTKKLIRSGKFDTYSVAEERIRSKQNAAMTDALRQFNEAERRGWR